MHRRRQFDMRENPASDRRHGSRPAVTTCLNENYLVEESQVSAQLSANDNHPPTGAAASPHAASHQAATGGEKRRHEGRLLTIHEVAELLQVPVSWVYQHTRRRCTDRIPAFRLGKYWRFTERDVIAWLAAKRENGYQHGHELR
jgi:excisionase family DNA binding protein